MLLAQIASSIEVLYAFKDIDKMKKWISQKLIAQRQKEKLLPQRAYPQKKKKNVKMSPRNCIPKKKGLVWGEGGRGGGGGEEFENF